MSTHSHLPATRAFRFAKNQAPLALLARSLPWVPELRLYLFPDELPQEKLAHDDFHALMAAPPYWAFCWGGGQALARHLLDEGTFVAARTVWDFGAGSGVAGIAAGLAGAGHVIFVDTDPLAIEMSLANARLNGVEGVSAVTQCNPEAGDIVLAADICYEEEGLLQVRRWAEKGVSVVVAESRLSRSQLAVTGLQSLVDYRVRTFPDLDESKQFDQVFLYRVNV